MTVLPRSRLRSVLGRADAFRFVAIALLAAVFATAAPIAYPDSKDETAKPVLTAEADTA